jgi:NTE family protein
MNNLKYTCIFGGGAIRGFAYIGALKALKELNIELDTLAGSSVGAIFAGLIAVGYEYDEIEEMLMKINFDLFKDIKIGKDFGLCKGEHFLEWIQELIEKKFYGENYIKGKNPPVKFSDLQRNLVIITTNLANFCCKEFSNFKTPDTEIAYAIRISASMPGLMHPIKLGNIILVDGDLQKSWPLWKLSENLSKQKERILEFRLEGDFDINKSGKLNFINSVYSCITAIATKNIANNYALKDKFDYIIINTGSEIIVDFNIDKQKRENLINLGYKQTKEYFSYHLKNKKTKLIEYYLPLYNLLEELQKNIELNNLNNFKNILGEFYMQYIQKISNYIDEIFIDDLNKIKDLFLNDYKFSPIFKKPILKKRKIVLSKIKNLKKDINKKISELKSYNIL